MPGAAIPAIVHLGHAFYRSRQYLSLALLIVSILAARPLVPDPKVERAVQAAAFVLVLLGGGVRSWAMGYHVWRRVHGPGSERRLVTAGPYALVRNPLYLGTLLITAGVAIMSGSWPIILVSLVVFWLGYLAVIAWEESRLGDQFGEEYRRYRARVPRLVPGPRIWSDRRGAFSFPTMIRCMEPVKTAGFLVALVLMALLKEGPVSG